MENLELFVKYFTKSKRTQESMGSMVFPLLEQESGLKKRFGEEGYQQLLKDKEANFETPEDSVRVIVFDENEARKTGLINEVMR